VVEWWSDARVWPKRREITARCSRYATVAQVSKPAVPPTSKSAGRVFEEHAGLETGDTADLEVCGTGLCRLSQRLGSKRALPKNRARRKIGDKSGGQVYMSNMIAQLI
jgi:hypothetical protein